MVDMRSIINVIKDLRNTVTLLENRASGNRDEVERLQYDVRLLELWAGLTSDTDGNCNIQHVRSSCPLCHGRGEYTTGGSFGGHVTVHKCDCGAITH